jgi:hypothetical protein
MVNEEPAGENMRRRRGKEKAGAECVRMRDILGELADRGCLHLGSSA